MFQSLISTGSSTNLSSVLMAQVGYQHASLIEDLCQLWGSGICALPAEMGDATSRVSAVLAIRTSCPELCTDGVPSPLQPTPAGKVPTTYAGMGKGEWMQT